MLRKMAENAYYTPPATVAERTLQDMQRHIHWERLRGEHTGSSLVVEQAKQDNWSMVNQRTGHLQLMLLGLPNVAH
jgi:hypothetical protein